MDNYGEVTVSIDIMKVNKIPFLVSISDHIHYGTSTAMPDMTEETMFSVQVVQKVFGSEHGLNAPGELVVAA